MLRRNSLVRLLTFLKPYRSWVVSGACIAVLASLVALAVPWFGRRVLDEVMVSRAPSDVTHGFFVLGILWIAAVGLTLVRDVLAASTGHRVIADIRQILGQHAVHLPVAYFDEARLGDFMSRL